MKKLLSFGMLLVTLAVAACGGGGNTITSPPAAGGPGAAPAVATVELLASSTQLPSDLSGVQNVTLTAVVKDENNNVVADVVVTIGATSGDLSVPSPVTDNNGIVTATLTTRDPANRTITVTASVQSASGTISDVIDVLVSGTQLSITPQSSTLAQGQQATYTVALRDAQGAGISGQTVDVTSANGNTISAASLTTGPAGQTQFTLTAAQGGADTITVTALGLTSTAAVNVSDDSFEITVPGANAEIGLGVAQTVTALWEKAGVPQAGQNITFSSTRGTLSASSAVTDAAGQASVTISSNNAGSAVITATNPEFTSASRTVEFVAGTADSLVLQASPFTVPTQGTSEISAVIRDPDGNLVKNKTVVFELSDNTGGQLSVAQDTTDSQGTARTTYTAGSSASAQNGVSIRAFVQDTPAVENTVALTVAAQELFIVIGTGNDLFEPTSALFSKEWAIIVTDVVGNPVANKSVQVSLLSDFYWKGTLVNDGTRWFRDPNAVRCADEDVNRNGILDPGEDFNSSGRVEAGNVSTVTPVPSGGCDDVGGGGSAQTTVTTDGDGIARVCVVYPQDHNTWVDVSIEASASVAGTEFGRSQQFNLDGLASDFSNVNASPPGTVSPFGPDLDCAIPPP